MKFNFDSEEEKKSIMKDVKTLNQEGYICYILPGADGLQLYFEHNFLTSGDIEVKNRLRILKKEFGI